ncbi:MAG TPA: c-type cytochrome [Ramlibacter sp.]|nr:c-type cytochrome [Ramlibacter sp.]
MSSCRKALRTGIALLVLAACATTTFAQGKTGFPGIGRTATPAEVAAWDIDVRPDFRGLPAGSGSVARGQEVWESKCASCHGVFGESNEVFNPLVGGTTATDIKTGRVASLMPGAYPGRTTLMKVPYVSTLWDYINRAMPWTQPKSLSVEEVYAATAYLLHLGGVLPADYTLSDKNMAEVQQRMPNRNGMTTDHALWPGKEFGGQARPDVMAKACMKDCAPERTPSTLPAHARNSHGNLADQNRPWGPQRGADTGRPQTVAVAPPAPAAQALAQKNNCTACHAADRKIVGPSWAEIAKKHEGRADYLAGKIRAGGSGAWGAVPMPPQSLSEGEAKSIASWLATGAKP